ncbi:hypothetical protein [Gracilibacillus sp. YIM 98692]|nr:hypothetical protein [Gracilibacillus sp. YIM 98692]
MVLYLLGDRATKIINNIAIGIMGLSILIGFTAFINMVMNG